MTNDEHDLKIAMVLDPVLDAHRPISIQRGLNVVYGLNGAGKTRFMAALRNVLKGVLGDERAGLLIQLKKGDASARSTKDIAVRLAASILRAETLSEELKTEFEQEAVSYESAVKIIDEYLLGIVPSSGAAREWVMEKRSFIVIPIGAEGEPGWQAWPVAVPELEWVEAEQVEIDAGLRRYAVEHLLRNEDEAESENLEKFQAKSEKLIEKATLFRESFGNVRPAMAEFDLWDLDPYSVIGYGHSFAALMSPIMIFGETDFGVRVIDYSESIIEVTRAIFARAMNWENGATSAGGVDVQAQESEVAIVAAKLGRAVTVRLQGFLADAPAARLRLSSAPSRLIAPPFEWEFSRLSDWQSPIPIEKLSRAEMQWAERAIIEAADEFLEESEVDLQPRLYMYDEPESGLHRSAEAHMAEALAKLACDPRNIVVAATHSPELLDADSASLIEVKRGSENSLVQPLDYASQTALEGLGLMPSDLLRLTRVILLVEGEHDAILLRHFLGGRLRRARVEIIPIRGGKKLPGTVDSRVLFDYTRAHVVALLDNVDGAWLDDVWHRATVEALGGDVAEAKKVVVEGIGNDSGEAGYLTTWLTRALDRGVDGRLSAEGLSARDVIEYLPVERIVPNAVSWDEMHRLHAEDRSSRSGVPADFKKWLTQRYKTEFFEPDLLRYATGVDVPKDFERLMKSLEARSADN